MSIAYDIDVQERTVEFEIPAAVYAEESLQIAVHIFDKRAEVELAADDVSYDVTLRSKKKNGVDEAFLRNLAGAFMNELLNQEYRALVGGFNKKITGLISTQVLFSARGGETPPEQADESAKEFKDDVKKMMDEARAEIKRTMPKKLPPQGIPMREGKKNNA